MDAYKKALKYLDDPSNPTDEEQKRIEELQVSLYSNSAACQLKCNDARGAVRSCNRVLDLQENNVKAWFRQGQAQSLLGEFQDAMRCLLKAKELTPEDAGVQREIQLVKQRQVQLKQKEKALFGQLFK